MYVCMLFLKKLLFLLIIVYIYIFQSEEGRMVEMSY